MSPRAQWLLIFAAAVAASYGLYRAGVAFDYWLEFGHPGYSRCGMGCWW